MSDSSIPTKDIKILWARSAGLCSMTNCRQQLTMDASSANATFALGEMCHIVGEKNSKKSPRGNSPMPEADRNRYSNLILLCAHHHNEIDKNVNDWPVEMLHKVKDEHELWVEESLSVKKLSVDELVYSTLIDNLDSALQLNAWNWFISNAVRNLVHRDFLDTLTMISERRLAVVWPGKNSELENSIKDLMSAFSEFTTHYMRHSTLSDTGTMLQEDTHYKRIYPNPNYDVINTRNMYWSQKNYCLLCIYTCRLNQFASQVRKYINPMFYLIKGNFLIIDELGVTGGGEAYVMLPILEEIQNRLSSLNEKILKFERLHKSILSKV